jgi:cytochrome P450
LPTSHPFYDNRFKNDHLKGLYPFSIGPRICLGRDLAWTQARLLIAKVFWAFDITDVSSIPIDLHATLRQFGFYEKPPFKAVFRPASHTQTMKSFPG